MNLRNLSMKIVVLSTISILLFISCQPTNEPAKDISLNPVFGDNMVIQQKENISIWGNAVPGGVVNAKIGDNAGSTIVDSSGKWLLELDPMDAGGPYMISVIGEDTLEISNVMIGEVWICSGQSNMEMPINFGWGKVNNYENELSNAVYPNIRLLKLDKAMATEPQNSFLSGGWKECSPQSVTDFSAVAYFFGRHLHHELEVPIGLIQSAWGGTVVEAWSSANSLKKFPEFTESIASLKINENSEDSVKQKLNKWPNEVENILLNSKQFPNKYFKADYKKNNWKTMNLPTIWEDRGIEVDGVVWFYKNIQIPQSWEDSDLTLSLGKINDFDITWFNEVKVGRGVEATDLRKYSIPKSIVKVGEIFLEYEEESESVILSPKGVKYVEENLI